MILVGTWTLEETGSQPFDATEAAVLDHGGTEGESTFADDNRVLVKPKDYEPGGQYRCKLYFLAMSLQ